MKSRIPIVILGLWVVYAAVANFKPDLWDVEAEIGQVYLTKKDQPNALHYIGGHLKREDPNIDKFVIINVPPSSDMVFQILALLSGATVLLAFVISRWKGKRDSNNA